LPSYGASRVKPHFCSAGFSITTLNTYSIGVYWWKDFRVLAKKYKKLVVKKKTCKKKKKDLGLLLKVRKQGKPI